MYIVTYDDIGGIFGPFDTKESADTYLEGSPYSGRIVEMIPPMRHDGLKRGMKESEKLYAEADKLWAEGGKLYAEGGKLCAEGR